MTFCVGIRVHEGVVVLSDTRVVKGSEVSQKSKMSTIRDGSNEAIMMTSGLRSIRDKVVARLEDRISRNPLRYRRLHDFASAYGEELRSVRAEDEPALVESGLRFNSNALIGGQFADDPEPVLLHVYPEGNWVEVTNDTPYVVIGRSSYGKPILDRILNTGSTLQQAASLAYLAFDATRTSASDVDFPIDIGIKLSGQKYFTIERLSEADMSAVHDAWNEQLRMALDGLPNQWIDVLVRRSEQDANS